MRISAYFILILTALCGRASDFTLDRLRYDLSSDGTCKLVDGSAASGAVVIPSEISSPEASYTVVAIAPSAFADNNSVTSVDIPASVKSIGVNAFYFCHAITEV